MPALYRLSRLRYPDRRLRAHLKRGGLIAYPTESCYGIGADPRNPRALTALLHLKRRPADKGMIVVGSGLAQLLPLLAKQPENVQTALTHIWPAPKTFILPASRRLLPLLRGRRRTGLAVRVPDHPQARQLCRAAGTALVSTSCNRAGRRPCRNAREVRRCFGRTISILPGRIGRRRRPSEIIDWHSGRSLR